MDKYIEVLLEKRNVRYVARMLFEEAPKTCEKIWAALPQEGELFHAKYASNELFTLVRDFSGGYTAAENLTVTPSIGDLLYFYFPPTSKFPRGTEYLTSEGRGLVDLALFYDRDNLLLSPSVGFTPGTVFARAVGHLEPMRDAGHHIWRKGCAGERLIFRQLPPNEVPQR
ncbi:MAG: DUF3830 family protein [Acidobacteriota bacterium]